ncbi:hypothetical protein [Nitrosococcus oceani]|nr:hypothetical protein [Nitrosococcus oceani]
MQGGTGYPCPRLAARHFHVPVSALLARVIYRLVLNCRRPPSAGAVRAGGPSWAFGLVPRASCPRVVGCFLFWGLFMSRGFVSVPSSRGAGVVARVCRSGWVWAWRALPGGPGWSPAPACVFVPVRSPRVARVFARSVAVGFGFRVWVRPGGSGSPVFAACGLPVPVWCVKVALPAGWSPRRFRAALARLASSAGAV